VPVVANPAGDCPAPDNGATASHAPGSARWLPDCKKPLRREYFRVFAKSESSAFMVPRPDHSTIARALCSSEAAGSSLRALLERYTLCAETPDVNRINTMLPADALAIAHALHEHLRFEANGGDVRPYPYSEDVLAVCELKPELAKGVLSDICDWEREHDRKRKAGVPIPAIGRVPPASEGPPLAAAMNELYGIAPQQE
jgi:hypothetical protein